MSTPHTSQWVAGSVEIPLKNPAKQIQLTLVKNSDAVPLLNPEFAWQAVQDPAVSIEVQASLYMLAAHLEHLWVGYGVEGEGK